MESSQGVFFEMMEYRNEIHDDATLRYTTVMEHFSPNKILRKNQTESSFSLEYISILSCY